MMVSLGKVSQDVLALVILKVHDSSRNSIFSLLRTNRALNAAVKPFVLRKVTLDFDESTVTATNERIAVWCEDKTALAAIRSIVVTSTSSAWRRISIEVPDTRERDYAKLTELLPRLKELKDFIFTCHYPIPSTILDTLHEHHLMLRLHIKNWHRNSPDTPFGDPIELKLAESPILRSFHAQLLLRHSRGIDLQYPAFLRIVTLAPNLESFHCEPRHLGGEVVYPYSHEQITQGSRQATLFQVENPQPKVFKAVQLGGILSSQLFESRFINWASLQTLIGLQIDTRSFKLDAPVFTSLKSLSVQFHVEDSKFRYLRSIPYATPNFDAFFRSLNPLKSLSVVNGLKYLSLPKLLAHHGHTLRTLHLHEVERPPLPVWRKPEHRITITLAEIRQIRDSCLLLRELGIDIDRTDSQIEEKRIYELLREASSTLTDLTLHFDLGLPFLQDILSARHARKLIYTYPKLQPSDLEALWEAVGGKQSIKLQQLTVFVGEQNRSPSDVYPPNWAFAEMERRRKFVVERNERDDRQFEVVISGVPGEPGNDPDNEL